MDGARLSSASMKPTLQDLERAIRRVQLLLEHKEPGLMSWNMMLQDALLDFKKLINDIYEA